MFSSESESDGKLPPLRSFLQTKRQSDAQISDLSDFEEMEIMDSDNCNDEFAAFDPTAISLIKLQNQTNWCY